MRSLLLVGQSISIVAALAIGFATTEAADWQPVWLIFVLLALAFGSDALAVQGRGLRISGSFAALVLGMVLLGPAPAMILGMSTIAVDTLTARKEVRYSIANFAAYAWFPLAGALVYEEAALHVGSDLEVAGLVFAVFVLANILNFTLVYGYLVLADGRHWREGVRNIYLPVLPAELAMGLMAATVVLLERVIGPGAIAMSTVIGLIFQYLLKIAMQAYDRGEQLEERNQQLAALQVGLISSMLKTLSLRDHMTARHSAAVARYSREMAAALRLSPQEQDLIHTAALFHDIGKFIFPDDILLSDTRLTDEQYEIVKQHPAVGAELISEIEGYGPVAEVVRHHHERMDGRGYPDGLDGSEIPLGSRIIAVADVYDVITARDTYRTPVTTAEAFAELRRSAGTQLDSELVELFISLVEERGVAFRHATAADFEAELNLDRRVRDYAAVKAA